jgi:hypothetical protein
VATARSKVEIMDLRCIQHAPNRRYGGALAGPIITDRHRVEIGRMRPRASGLVVRCHPRKVRRVYELRHGNTVLLAHENGRVHGLPSAHAQAVVIRRKARRRRGGGRVNFRRQRLKQSSRIDAKQNE